MKIFENKIVATIENRDNIMRMTDKYNCPWTLEQINEEFVTQAALLYAVCYSEATVMKYYKKYLEESFDFDELLYSSFQVKHKYIGSGTKILKSFRENKEHYESNPMDIKNIKGVGDITFTMFIEAYNVIMGKQVLTAPQITHGSKFLSKGLIQFHGLDFEEHKGDKTKIKELTQETMEYFDLPFERLENGLCMYYDFYKNRPVTESPFKYLYRLVDELHELGMSKVPLKEQNVYLIHGTNGAGKTTLVKNLLFNENEGGVIYLESPGGVTLTLSKNWCAIGEYTREKTSGGADGISTLPETFEATNYAAKCFPYLDILVEGSMVCMMGMERRKNDMPKNTTYMFLNTPLEQCGKNVERRHRQNGRPDKVAPLENMGKKVKSNESIYNKTDDAIKMKMSRNDMIKYLMKTREDVYGGFGIWKK